MISEKVESIEGLQLDNYLVHFTSSEVGIQKILYTNQLLFSWVSRSDDPFEDNLSHLTLNGPPEILHTTDQRLYPIVSGAGLGLTKVFDVHSKARILCFSCPNEKFSDIRDSAPFLNAKMWIEYGRNQSGLCLILDKKKVLEAFSTIAGDKKFDRVAYRLSSEMLLNRPEGSINNYLEKGEHQYIAELVSKYLNYYIFEKHVSFHNEQEFRLCLIPESPDEVFLDISNCLNSVVVTEKIEPFLLEYLLKKYESTGIGVYTVNWSAREVELSRKGI